MNKIYNIIVRNGYYFDTIIGVCQFTEINCRLVNFSINDYPYGTVLKIHAVEAESYYTIAMFTTSPACLAFYAIAKKLNPIRDLTISVGIFGQKEYLIFKQDGKTLTNSEIGNCLDVKALNNFIFTTLLSLILKQSNPYPAHPLYRPIKLGRSLCHS
ncbi:hypothetical protein LX64_04148 [Chitinophaga skermanii]|uniref:Uncharacterized protein n=1 Tax=Chitinophaga skermanii TaxID=331697 RepID=A0A327Q9Y5_9BACT|nr:hypothetical protein [Chitinophaga skermanii]RAJ00442.1 hypothetical protein LX64_04148 [Chitinophaga skermanii]